MKKASVWLLLGIFSLAGVAWSQGRENNGTEKAIMALEIQWLKSYQTNNPDSIAPTV